MPSALISPRFGRDRRPNKGRPTLDAHSRTSRLVDWQSVTVVSAAILIGAEAFGAASAGGWALADVFDLGLIGEYILTAAFCVIGIVIMAAFVRNGMKVEPFTTRS